MCTALTLKTNDGHHLFGRNMDLEYTFGQTVVLMPRNFKYEDKVSGQIKNTKYAVMGMASLNGKHPLFADALNEKGRKSKEYALTEKNYTHQGKRIVEFLKKVLL